MKSPGSWLAASLVGVTAWFGVATSARATEASLRLSVVRDELATTCPDAEAIEAGVRARLRRDPFARVATTQVEVLFSAASAGYRARIRTVASGGAAHERALVSDEASCASLADATSLALALYIDPNALASAAAPAPPPAPPAPVPPRDPSPPPLPQEREAPVAGSRGPTSLAASGVVAIGALPRASVGAGVSGSIALGPRFAGELFGWLLPEVRADDRRFGFGMTAAGARACFDLVRAARGFAGPCAGAEGGEIHAVVYDALPTKPGGRAFVAATADLRGQLHLLGPLVATAHAGVAAPFVRPRFFVIDEPATIFQQSALLVVGELGVGMSIP